MGFPPRQFFVHAARPAGRVIRSVLRSLIVLFGVSIVAFAIIDLAPGDFLSGRELDPGVSRDALAGLRNRYGLDRPLPARYGRWLASVLRGEAGYSLAYGAPVAPLLAPRARATALLAASALATSWGLALGLGVWAAARANRWDGRLLATSTSTLMGVPDLLLALGLLIVAARTGLFPTGGLSDDLSRLQHWPARFLSAAHHLVLPVTALAAGMLPTLFRHVRSSLLDVLRTPYIRAQRARGVPERRVLWAGLRAAANPLVSLLGLSFAAVFSASMAVEVILSWPGLGPFFMEAVLARDVHIVLAGVLCSTALLVAGNLIGDMLLVWVDPRVRAE